MGQIKAQLHAVNPHIFYSTSMFPSTVFFYSLYSSTPAWELCVEGLESQRCPMSALSEWARGRVLAFLPVALLLLVYVPSTCYHKDTGNSRSFSSLTYNKNAITSKPTGRNERYVGKQARNQQNVHPLQTIGIGI